MPEFSYTARGAGGEVASGIVAAESKREALDALARQSLFPITVEPASKGEINIKWLRRRPPDALLAATLNQLADLLDNGVPVLAAFQVLVKQTRHPVLNETLADILEQISEGESIDRAFAAHNRIFNDLTLSIIRAGAEGAFLEDALRRTARFLEQQAETQGKIVAAMVYPTILLGVGFLVVTVLLTAFVPMFKPMFEQAEASGGLPLPTVILLETNRLIMQYGLYALGGFALTAFFLRGRLATPYGKRFLDRYKLKMPLLGNVLLESAVSRFCRVLGTLLENGVPILRALDISSNSTGNAILADAVRKSAESVSAGEPLSKPLADTGIMPPRVMAMITVAEESNTLENVLVKIADTIDRQTDRTMEMLIRIIEPVMLLCMAVAVFCIILALLLPIFRWASSNRRRSDVYGISPNRDGGRKRRATPGALGSEGQKIDNALRGAVPGAPPSTAALPAVILRRERKLVAGVERLGRKTRPPVERARGGG